MKPLLRILLLSLSVFLFSSLTNLASGQATVTTDLPDYPPGATVNITGYGWTPGEQVKLQLIHYGESGDNQISPAHVPWYVSVAADSTIISTWIVPLDEDELGATLLITADEQTSGLHAEATFTDAITIWANPISTNNSNLDNPYTTGQTVSTRITVSGIGRGTGITGDNQNNRYNAVNWSSGGSLDPNDYFYFTLTPNTGYHINFNNFAYNAQRNGQGPNNFSFRSNANSNNFSTDIGTATATGTTISLTASAYQNITTSTEFRLYGWGAGMASGTFSVNDFTFSGAILGTSVTALSGFSTCVNVASTAKSFIVNGEGLTANSVITITPSTNYEVSKTSAVAGFQGSGNVTLTTDGLGAVSGTTIWVRLKANATPGTYNGENINVSGGGFSVSNNINVVVSGQVNAPTCSISGPDDHVCPSSSNDYTAPNLMSSYLWEIIAGSATIAAGEQDDQTATVIAGSGCNTSFTLKLTITDANGCTSTCTKTLTVEDKTAPTFTRPADKTIYTSATCTYDASVSVTGDVTNEADNCSTGLQATFVDGTPVALAGCQGGYTITRTWSLVDNCGNAAADQLQTITVRDNIAPTFTRPADKTIYTSATCTYDASVTATGDVTNEADNCSTGLQATFVDGTPVALAGCQGGYTITRTWSLVDNCGNAAADQLQTITVRDNIAPTFTRPADKTIYTSATCTYDASVTATGDVTNEADNCSTGLQATFVDGTPVALAGCQGGYTITRTWSLVDNCGNAAADQLQTITVRDNIAPTFTRPADKTIYTSATCTYDASVSATGDVTNEADNCSTGLQATFVDGTPVALAGCQGGYTITRTWSLVDNCGNAAADQVQTITVRDNIAPTFTRPADKTIYTSATCTYDASVTATGDVTNEADNCSTGLQATFVDGTPVALAGCQGGYTITRTWSLVDNCGNAAADQLQTITVRDNIAPTFTRPADKTIYTSATCTYDASVSVTGDVTNEADNCSTGLQATFVDGTPVALAGCQGGYTITRTWSLVDNCGNAAADQVQTITVRDNIAPTFTRPADKTIYTSATCTYDASVTATGDVTNEADNCSTGLQATFVDGTPVALAGCQGGYTITRTWSLVDNCGNAAADQLQTITVRDNIAPTFTRPADKTIYTSATCTYDASVTATGDVTNEADNCSTGLQATFVDGTPVALAGCQGGYTITRTWSLVDNCGNAAADQLQTITVRDNIAPTFTRPADKTIYTSATCTYDASVTATGDVTNEADNCSTGLQATFSDVAVAGPYLGSKVITRTWKLKDNCNNTATDQVQTITVSDNTPPAISLLTTNPTCLWPPNHKMRDITVTPTITDNCGGTLNWAITSVSSNEPVNGTGDGNTGPDWIIGTGADGIPFHGLQLRAEREGTGNGRIYTITVTATDAAGNTSTKTATVCVAHNITSPANGNAVKVGSTVALSGTFWDVAGKTHTAKWDIDGTLVSGTGVEPSGTKNGTVTGSYKFTTPGIYKLQMNVTDQTGITSYANTNGDMEAIAVVYDPNGGYTYGSGSFVSSPGAIPSNSSVTGQVSFGFQSNYYKGATNPKGETEFKFSAGDLGFNALNFDYLVVNGAKAQFKGLGKMTTGLVEQSGIAFILTAIDGQITGGGGVDKIRMKIYNKTTGQVYYDNQPGASDAADPVTPVTSGSCIVIVNTSPLSTSIVRVPIIATTPATAFKVKVLPNPTSYYFNLGLSSASKEKVKITVVDITGRVIEQKTDVPANSTLQLGNNYHPGVYFAEVIQGNDRIVLKLIKEGK